jgi:hypothetical protein
MIFEINWKISANDSYLDELDFILENGINKKCRNLKI